MKTKWFLLITALALCLLAAGCAKANPAGENFADVVTDWQPESRREGYGEPSDITTYDAPGFAKELGFVVTDYPDDDALHPFKFFAIDYWFCQMEYQTEDERVLVLRIAREDAGGKRLADTYHDHYSHVETTEVDGVSLRVANGESGCTLASWVKNGFQYIVHSTHLQDAPAQGEIETLVRGLNCAEADASSVAAD